MLYYYKCLDCLTPFSVTERHNKLTCLCGGTKCQFMGQVKGNLLERTEEKCACDMRCTHATGPVCDCQCGGENHGTGRIVTVIIHSNIPVAQVNAESVARGKLWRALVASAERRLKAVYGELYEKYVISGFIYGGQGVDSQKRMELHNDVKAFRRAKSLKVDKMRVNAIMKVCPSVSVPPPLPVNVAA